MKIWDITRDMKIFILFFQKMEDVRIMMWIKRHNAAP